LSAEIVGVAVMISGHGFRAVIFVVNPSLCLRVNGKAGERPHPATRARHRNLTPSGQLFRRAGWLPSEGLCCQNGIKQKSALFPAFGVTADGGVTATAAALSLSLLSARAIPRLKSAVAESPTPSSGQRRAAMATFVICGGL
jgi:hypothetical protein